MVKNINEEEFKNNVNNIIGENSSNFLIFYADWCPDCVNIEKFNNEFDEICKKDGFEFYRIDVGNKEHYREPNNYFRNLDKIKLSNIPTGMIIKNGKFSEKKLVEKDFLDEEKRKDFFKF